MRKQNLISIGAIHLIVVLFFLFVYLTPTHFTFLNWNVFLALLPLDFALVVAFTKRVTVGTIFSILWLLFYPNTMYMITDYIHLQYIGIGLTVRMQYFNYAVLSAGIFIGVVLGILSLELIFKHYFDKRHDLLELFLMAVLSILSGVGIYIGRFLRLNSWDVFTRLQHVLSLIAESFSMHMIVFVTLFAGVQFAILVISHYGVRLIQNTVDK